MNHNEKMQEYYERCSVDLMKGHLKDLLQKAEKNIQQISVDDIDLENMVLIDVRENDEFASGVIPAKKVFTIPRGKLEFALNEQILELSDHTIVCYCLKGARGLLAAQTLTDLGLKNVVNLKGGIESWVNENKIIKNYLGSFQLQKANN